jgi:predicted Zn-dependent protease
MGSPSAPNGRRAMLEASAILLQHEVGKLALLSAIAVAAFLITHAAASANHAQRQVDAAAWRARGEEARAAGRLDAAVEAFQRATAMDRERADYRLALAAALSASGRDTAARQVLLGVRMLTPDDPKVNEQLARLEARAGDLDAAVRYYQAALYGRWPVDQAAEYRALRVELVELLLANGQASRALSELLVLSGNIPDDVASHVQLGALLTRAGDPSRGLDQFRKALATDPSNQAAQAGAARAAFAAGDYRSAQRYFARLPASSELADARAVTDLVFSRDPLAPGLGIAERRARLAAALTASLDRLTACAARQAGGAAEPALAGEVRAFRERLDTRRVRDREEIGRGLALVLRLELAAGEGCPLTPLDRALVIVARRHEAE